MIINDLPFEMLKCLIYTIIIEIIISLCIGIRNKKDFINIFLVNVMTNPIVTSVSVYYNIRYGIVERNIVLIILEMLAVIVEGFVYKKYLKYEKINPYVLSIILNYFSYFLGEIINLF